MHPSNAIYTKWENKHNKKTHLLADNLCAHPSQRGVHVSQDPCVTFIRATRTMSLRKWRPSSARAVLFLRTVENIHDTTAAGTVVNIQEYFMPQLIFQIASWFLLFSARSEGVTWTIISTRIFIIKDTTLSQRTCLSMSDRDLRHQLSELCCIFGNTDQIQVF